MSIKVAEIFESIQAEGVHVGVPSIFLRTFGCNFTCKNFGRDRNDTSPSEYLSIDPSKYTDFKQLPLVKTGCDSYASWSPAFKDFSPLLEIPAIVDRMVELIPSGKFGHDQHLIITGGEPLLGWQKQYPDLFNEIYERELGLTDLTFETNGTQNLSEELAQSLNDYTFLKNLKVTFSVSAKLPCSGEPWERAILPDRLMQYTKIRNANVYLKFVVSNDEDLQDVHKAVAEYKKAGFSGPVYLMPVGGTADSYFFNNKTVAELAMKYGYRYSPRLQVDLFKNEWGT